MKLKKSDLLNMIQEQNDVIAKLIRQVNCHHKDIIRIEGVIEPEPQLKQLDQSVFPLIERDTAKGLLEVDLSSELTGSDLTEQIMKNQKYQAAFVSDESEYVALKYKRTALIDNVYTNGINERFRAGLTGWSYAIPINNQGEPLTASEVGL